MKRVEIQGTSKVEGDIHTKSIVVLEGGVINGTVRMGETAAQDGNRDRRELATDAALRHRASLESVVSISLRVWAAAA
jgi:cytoskeletal protein CcmA (bactofilin family)